MQDRCHYWSKQQAGGGQPLFYGEVDCRFHSNIDRMGTVCHICARWLADLTYSDFAAGCRSRRRTHVQLAITLGETVGGILFDSAGYQATFAISAIVLVAAALLAALNMKVRAAKTS